MDDPWFRKWMALGYIPISWQGWAVILSMLLVAAPSGAFSLILAESAPVASGICAALFVGAAVVGHVIVLRKLQRTYGS